MIVIRRKPFWLSRQNETYQEIPHREGVQLGDLIADTKRAGLWVTVNAEPCADWTREIQDGDTIVESTRPYGVELGTAIVSFIAESLIYAGVSFILGKLIGGLTKPKKRNDDESTTYAWSGLANDRVEGQPLQVIYGEIRVAPQVIDEYIVSDPGTGESTLRMLLSFGEGPITAFGNVTTDTPNTTPLSSDDPANPLPRGLQIEGNAAENFSGIKCWVRMGTSEQEPIPGFELVNTEYNSGITLTQEETTASSNLALNPDLDISSGASYYSNSAAAQAVWDDYGVAVDMTEEADEFACIIDFPQGLYTVSGSGSTQSAYFTAIVRYIELDSGGLPITSGGNNGDGYVYVPPTGLVAVKKPENFSYQITAPLLDPTGYTPGALGDCLTTGTSDADHVTTASPATLPSGIVAGAQIQEMTITCWVYFTGDWEGAASETQYAIASHRATSPNRGWVWYIEKESFPAKFKLRISGYAGGAAFSHVDNSSNQLPRNQWVHIAFVWDFDNGDSNPAQRVTRAFYVNGVLWSNHRTSQAAAALHVPGGAIKVGGYPSLGGTDAILVGLQPNNVKVDEFTYRFRALTSTEIGTEYSAGLGRYVVPGSDTTFAAIYHFDSGTALTDFSGRGNTLTASGAAVAGTTDGKVYQSGSSAEKRMKARVEVLRLNLKSTSQFVVDESVYSALIAKLQTKLAYPYTPIMALEIKATGQLNTSAPTVTQLVKGRPVPTYNGSAVVETYSNNPAWVLLDIGTNPDYGCGQDFPIASRVNLADFQALADYADELIPDGRDYNDQEMDETPSPGGTSPIVNLYYDSTLNSGYGGIIVYYRHSGGVPTTVPPSYWTAGRYIGFTGTPSVGGGLAVDISTANIPGMEIVSKTLGATGWELLLKYDSSTYGDPWTSGTYFDTSVTAALVGTAIGVEKRYTYNGVWDTLGNAWDAMVSVAQTCRAMPMIEGGVLRVRYERPRTASAMVSMANIKPDSFRVIFADSVNADNSLACDFLDEDANYQRSVASFDDPDLDDTAEAQNLKKGRVDLPGVTRRSQVMRHLDYLLRVNRLTTEAYEWTSGLDQLALEVGDVVQLAHDIVPFGTSGRVSDIGTNTTTTIYLDRDLVIGAGTYKIKIQSNALGQQVSGSEVSDFIEERTISTGAGTVTYGSSISVSSAFTFIPAKGDQFVVYTAAQSTLVQIVEATLSESFERNFRALKYDATIYDVDTQVYALPQSTSESLPNTPTGAQTIPDDVLFAAASQSITRQADGSFVQSFTVSWQHSADTIKAVAKTRILWRNSTNEAWDLAATVEGQAESATFSIGDGEPERYFEFAIQPVSFGGLYRRPEALTKVAATLRGIYVPPEPPTAFTATMQGNQAVYSVTPPDNARGLVFEIRRGGWILGQPVAIIPEGQTKIATTNWCGHTANALGEAAPKLYCRSRDSRGQYSRAVVLEDFNPAPDGAVILQPPYSDYTNYPDTSWEDFASSPGAWVNGGLNQPTLTNLQVTAYDGRNVLEFSGSNLTGNYLTAGKLSALTAAPEWAHIQCSVVVDQDSPITVASTEIESGYDPAKENITAEGLLTLPPGQESCTIKIWMRFTTSAAGSFGDWVEYQPGEYNFVNVQFRVNFTRPDTQHNIRVYRIATRLTRLPTGVWERQPVKDGVMRRMMYRG